MHRDQETLHGLVEAQARLTPDATALVSDRESATYAELLRRTQGLARRLQAMGVEPEAPVGVLLDRSPRLVEGLLGVLAAGGFYVPVDPHWPADRLAFLAEDSRAPLWISETALAGRLPVPAERVLFLDEPIPPLPDTEDAEGPLPAVLPDNLAYAIYTSGSTGRPKGVQIPHRAAVNFLESMRRRPGLDASDVLLAVTTVSFDIAVLELFLPLTAGARVVIAPRAAAADASALAELIERHGVTVLQATPATWRLLLASGWRGRPGLRILCGGEALPRDLADRLLERGAELWNLYGPTETTVWSAVQRVGSGPVAIGEPVARTDLRLLGDPGEDPESGELGIGGAGLARGYLRRPDLTAERFVPHPDSPEPGARLYRTGDLVRSTPAGLEFLGRIDHQVKIRGYRIELGEIEAAMRSHPGVADAVAVAREASPGDLRLVGYVTPGAGFAGPGQDGWQAERIDQWRSVYDQASDLAAIWKSSYTGEPFPEDELRVYHGSTVERLLALRPERVLEIGCGTGPILLPLLPHVAHYCGTDFSDAALGALRGRLAELGEPLASRVRLLHRPADDFSDLEPGSFDLVVLNSVAQYFPGPGYLLDVIEGALRRLRPGGFLFLGDLRSLPLLETFAASVRLFQAPFPLPAAQLRLQVKRQVEREPELLVDPAAVDALRRRFPGIRRAWTWLRRGRRDNELTRFRYDAVLETGLPADDPAPVERVWGRDVASLEELRTALPDALLLRRIPNARLTRERLALRRLESQDASAGALRDALREADAGVHPEDLWDLETTLPCTVHVGWSASGEPGEMDALLVRHGGPVPAFSGRETPERPWSELVSDPLQGKVAAALVPALRGHLRDRLPEYMVPAALVVLRALPLTPNRKVDRKALPAPDLARQESDEGFLAPRNDLEREVARVFAEVLGVERVGVRDDFFEMGGHSLLGTQLTYRLRDGFGVELPLNALFEAPTVEALAARIGGLPRASASAAPEIVEPDPGSRHEPFPLNDIQQAYWIGRSPGLELGGVACRFYQQFEARGLDLGRLERAWNRLVERHGMLRAVVAADGTQRILDAVPAYRIRVRDEPIETTRHRMLHELRPPDEWPLFGVEAHRMPDGLRIHVLLELLVVDGLSILILFEEWGRLYADLDLELPPLHLSFRDYVLAEAALERTERFARARGYWMERLSTLPPPPALPLARNPAALGRPEFTRHGAHLPADLWRSLKERAQKAGLWPSALLCAAYAEVLRVWSREPRFTLNLTLFNRLAVHPEVNRILGDFTTLDLLEVDGRGSTFAERARGLQARLFSDLENRAFSGVKVLRELARERPGSAARMPVVFTSFLEDFSRTDWLGPVVDRLGQTPQVWLDHVILERAGVLELDWYAVEELFPPGLLTAMFEAYTGLLHRLATEESVWQEARPVGPPAAQLAERSLVNATAAPVPAGLLHEPFLAQARLRPDQAAVIAPARTLTYAELRRRSGRLARQLREAGARPNELVAVVMRKGWEQVVAVLAILEAGAAYLPLDADLPAARLEALIERGEARIVVTQSEVAEVAEAADGPEVEALAPVQTPDDLAYVLFTSGSTGVPKGVMIDHRGALNTVADVNARFGVGPADRVLGLSSLGFDLSVYDVFGVLGAGGTLVLPAAEDRNEPARWAGLVERERITVWNSVPALLDLVLDLASQPSQPSPKLDSLRLVLLSGDWIPLSLPDRLRRRAPGAEVISLGGATEASIWSILHPVGEVDPAWRSVPYGRPMVNQTFHVLDEDLEPCPVWVPGHLHIGGVGLARGYWRDEERTRESFIPGPAGERLYRTGDLGRYLPGGDIEFLGREDGQVKIQGNRVELGEVESALALHPRVHAAAAAVRGPRDGARRLLAWYVPAEPAPDPAELRAFLAGRLPAYMVPSQLVPLSNLPLSANGKVDRAALPEPERDGEAGGRLAPRDPVERVLAGLATALLDGERPGVEDNFFSVGGNSLTAIRLIARLRDRFHVELPVVRFFDAPTVAGLAGSLLGCQVEHHGEAAVEPLLSEVEAVPEAHLEEALARELGLLGWREDA
ncbi:MAG: amino acid adenylation domain-containing protein [Acidobacteriota bacterium]